jgi:hypothetical protein
MCPLVLSLSHMDSSSPTSGGSFPAASPSTHEAPNLALRRTRTDCDIQTLYDVDAYVPGVLNLLLLKLSYLARKVDVNIAEQLLPGVF